MNDFIATLNTIGSGSYAPGDVHFLLQAVQMSITDIKEKERLIQSNQKHYSEMISQEHAPSDVHKSLYARALVQNGARMAADVQSLALALNATYTGASITLVSFVRAGPMHLRMAGDDGFDQRRTGTRHAQHKNRKIG